MSNLGMESSGDAVLLMHHNIHADEALTSHYAWRAPFHKEYCWILMLDNLKQRCHFISEITSLTVLGIWIAIDPGV